MFGGSGKIGRGGNGSFGRGRRVNSSFPPPTPSIRPPSNLGRASLSGGNAIRNRTTTSEALSNASSRTTATEESFNLICRNALVFASIIRLAPDLVEEIKRVEAQGGTARIKFESSGQNPAGNVIEVGEKVYRFVWSADSGELCNIYEEHQSGEDGDGLLLERGCAWRKLNVQRVLDESTKNHVKMRSEEAERKLKSRKAIVLEQSNPSLKSQAKAMAAVEANSWRTGFKQKEFKKRKLEPCTGSQKSVQKYMPPPSFSKGRRSSSPLSSPPNQHPSSQNPQKGQTAALDAAASQHLPKTNATCLDKNTSCKVTSATVQEQSGSDALNATDLQSILTTVLKENPMGVSLKALEKAVGGTVPGSMNLESIVEKVAIFQSPDRYVLKAVIDSENIKGKGGQRIPQGCNSQSPMIEGKKNPHPSESISRKGRLVDESEEQLDHMLVGPNIDTFLEQKHSENGKGQEATSSDSESDSSDSRSDSGSRSRSPNSTSDSESDATINSKQGSDEDVDILTSEDNKELRPKPDMSVQHLPFPVSHESPHRNIVENGFVGNFDVLASNEVEDIDIISTLPDAGKVPIDEGSTLPERNVLAQRDTTVREASYHEQRSPYKHHEVNSNHSSGHRNGNLQISKRLKPENSTYVKDGQSDQSLDRYSGASQKTPSYSSHISRNAGSDRNADHTTQNLRNHVDPEAPVRNVGTSAKASEVAEKNDKVPEGTTKHRAEISESSFGAHESFAFPKDRDRRSGEDSKHECENRNIAKVHVKSPSYDKNRMNQHGEGRFPDRVVPRPNESVQGEAQGATKQLRKNQFGVSQSGMKDSSELGLHERKSVSSKQSKLTEQPTVMQANGFVEHSKMSRNPRLNAEEKHDRKQGSSSSDDPKKKIVPSVDRSDEKKVPLAENSTNIQANGVHLSDSESCPFSKYAKNDPDLKGPIKDFDQYQNYAQEYREKYDSYMLLNKTLESYRTEFSNLGRDLEAAKDQDRKKYYYILGQLTESYSRCGAKHKRLKKIFIILHQELKQLKQRIKDYAASYTKV